MAFARDFWSLAVTVVIWTFGEMLFFPASAAYATDVAPDERRGEYSGLYTMTFSLAFAIGPWAGTVVLERLGALTLWSLTFVLGPDRRGHVPAPAGARDAPRARPRRPALPEL